MDEKLIFTVDSWAREPKIREHIVTKETAAFVYAYPKDRDMKWLRRHQKKHV